MWRHMILDIRAHTNTHITIKNENKLQYSLKFGMIFIQKLIQTVTFTSLLSSPAVYHAILIPAICWGLKRSEAAAYL